MTSVVTPAAKGGAEKHPQRMERRVEELRAALRSRQPQSLASLTGSVYEDEVIRLPLWGRPLHLSWADLRAFDAETGSELPMHSQALLLYYLSTGDGTPLAGRWISFAELPDGRFYDRAFQGYTGRELSRHFADRREAFRAAAEANGGCAWPMGDQAYLFWPLPRLPLLVVHWLGDEDFPPSYKILFDASASHYLPTDACAILGSMLTRRLISP